MEYNNREKNRKEIHDLMCQLYIKEFIVDIHQECALNSVEFAKMTQQDIRFNAIYNDYKSKGGELNMIQFGRSINKSELMWNLVKDMLDLPDELKPKQLYTHVKYPFLFETVSNFFRPEFEDFVCETNSDFNKSITKIFYDLTEEEIDNRKIKYLKNKIQERKDAIKKRREEYPKTKRIFKYDSNGLIIMIYNSRRECCEQEGFKKSALSLHLSGNRKTLNGYTYKEVMC